MPIVILTFCLNYHNLIPVINIIKVIKDSADVLNYHKLLVIIWHNLKPGCDCNAENKSHFSHVYELGTDYKREKTV